MSLPVFFDNEELITESDDRQILLTNRRVRQTKSNTDLVSIMLEKVSSVEVNYFHLPILLLSGFLILVYGLITQTSERDLSIVALLVGIILIAIYLITRKHVVIISSDGGAKITFRTQGISSAAVMSFINKLEEAKGKLI